ncbi:MAG: DUF3187 family protein [Thermoanaerobaculia bacterium]|nr:DUF3187 family protein [Thermoanaerobaculia bacterium]
MLLAGAARVHGQSADSPVAIPGTRSLYVLDVPFLHFGPLDVSSPGRGKLAFDFEVAYGNTFSHTWHPQAIHNEFERNSLPFSRDEAETLHRRHPEDVIAFVDADVTRLALRATWGLTGDLSVAAEIPYVSFAGLRFDSFVESFHRALGMYDGQRASFPRNNYLVVRQRPFGALEYDDRLPSAGLSDLVASLRYRRTFAVGVRLSADLAVKAPTGDANESRGSGSVDAGLLVGASCRLGSTKRIGVRAEAGLVVPGPFRGNTITTLDATTFLRLLVGADARLGRRTFVGLSVTAEQSPFRHDAVGDGARTALDVALGLSHRFGDRLLASLALTENVPRYGDSTDVVLALAVKFVP